MLRIPRADTLVPRVGLSPATAKSVCSILMLQSLPLVCNPGKYVAVRVSKGRSHGGVVSTGKPEPVEYNDGWHDSLDGLAATSFLKAVIIGAPGGPSDSIIGNRA